MAEVIYVHGPELLSWFEAAGDELAAPREPARLRENLTRWLGRYCELKDCDGVVVYAACDPMEVLPPTERFGRATAVNIPFGGAPLWRELAMRANREPPDRRPIVVTEDPRLTQAVARGPAKVLRPGRFVASARAGMRRRDEMVAGEPDEKFTGLTDGEVDFWVQYFEDE